MWSTVSMCIEAIGIKTTKIIAINVPYMLLYTTPPLTSNSARICWSYKGRKNS